MKMAMRMTPSMMERQPSRPSPAPSFIRLTSQVGSTKNSRMASAIPTTMAIPMMTFMIFSPNTRSSHFSNREGSSSSSPSTLFSADSFRALKPIFMESIMAAVPRMMGQPRMGYLSFRFSVGRSLTSMVLSGLRTPTAVILGPRIIMPSTSA